MTKRLMYAGSLAGPLFVLALIVEGGTRTGYDATRHPISSLALGDLGWTQVANFIVSGLLSLALGAGLWRLRSVTPDGVWPVRARLGAVLIGVWGACFVATGIFPTDPVSGYPAGTAAVPVGTMNGMLHNLAALSGALALVIACFVLAGGGAAWTAYSVATAVVFVVCFGLASVGLGQASGLVDIAGLLQRVAVIAGWAWLTAVAVRAARSARTAELSPAARLGSPVETPIA